MKIASVIGARPQFIKYAPLSKELRKVHHDILIHTGQHYDYSMDKVFFNELGIPEPDFNLGVGSGSHAYQTGEMLKGIEDILIREKPDLVMVYGDTNSTLAGSLAAAKLHIRVVHVEAGLRSYDKSMPEEINRVLIDHCADFLFCPTQTAVANLYKENIHEGVYFTGDVMVDALHHNLVMAYKSDVLERLHLTPQLYLLATIHRASNTDNKQNLSNILRAFVDIGQIVVFPVHPRTRKFIQEYGLNDNIGSGVILTDPLGYFDFLKLLSQAQKVLTDSGGVQKEAYILKVPCITLRDNTEWAETIEDGWNVLVGADYAKIVNLARHFNPTHSQTSVFGVGACKKILKILGC